MKTKIKTYENRNQNDGPILNFESVEYYATNTKLKPVKITKNSFKKNQKQNRN